jgi:hypothetical protein
VSFWVTLYSKSSDKDYEVFRDSYHRRIQQSISDGIFNLLNFKKFIITILN